MKHVLRARNRVLFQTNQKRTEKNQSDTKHI